MWPTGHLIRKNRKQSLPTGNRILQNLALGKQTVPASGALVSWLDNLVHSLIQCLWVPAVLCAGHCASSWGLKQLGINGSCPTSQVIPSLVETTILDRGTTAFRLDGSRGFLTDLHASSLILHSAPEKSLQTHVRACSFSGEHSVATLWPSPLSFPLGDGVVNILAFLLFPKQARPTPMFVALHLLFCKRECSSTRGPHGSLFRREFIQTSFPWLPYLIL